MMMTQGMHDEMTILNQSTKMCLAAHNRIPDSKQSNNKNFKHRVFHGWRSHWHRSHHQEYDALQIRNTIHVTEQGRGWARNYIKEKK